MRNWESKKSPLYWGDLQNNGEKGPFMGPTIKESHYYPVAEYRFFSF